MQEKAYQYCWARYPPCVDVDSFQAIELRCTPRMSGQRPAYCFSTSRPVCFRVVRLCQRWEVYFTFIVMVGYIVLQVQDRCAIIYFGPVVRLCMLHRCTKMPNSQEPRYSFEKYRNGFLALV